VRPNFHEAGMIVVAIGMIGATVMPHNLFLHSALVQTRKLKRDEHSIRTAIRFNTLDSVAALTVAFFVNAAILVLRQWCLRKAERERWRAARCHVQPRQRLDTHCLSDAAPLLGTVAASTLFAVALLASGQSSTITGTLAGQVVMEGFMRWRIRPWIRRMISRTLAVVPAIWIISVRGNAA